MSTIKSYQKDSELHTIYISPDEKSFYHKYYDQSNPLNFGFWEMNDKEIIELLSLEEFINAITLMYENKENQNE